MRSTWRVAISRLHPPHEHSIGKEHRHLSAMSLPAHLDAFAIAKGEGFCAAYCAAAARSLLRFLIFLPHVAHSLVIRFIAPICNHLQGGVS